MSKNPLHAGGRSFPTVLAEILSTPDLTRWEPCVEASASARSDGVRAMFLGVSTILLRDSKTAVLTDGFFSRPGILRASLGRIRPRRGRIRTSLRHARVESLDAVFVNHSHFDHALDSAVVASMTDAWLIGSPSTREIARGARFRQERFLPAVDGEPLRFGDFRLTPVLSVHSPDDRVPGVIDAPVPPPARVSDYRSGESYSLHVDHPSGSLLIHASAGFRPGALRGYRADTVYLGIGVLGLQPVSFREQYWDEVVATVGAKRVVPIHWDNFTRSLRRPLTPMPRPFDDVAESFEWLQRRAERDGVAFSLPRVAVDVNPWP